MPKPVVLNEKPADTTARQSEMPKALKPYRFHGVSIQEGTGEEWVGECPFCSRPKFSANAETGMWTCFACGGGTEKGGGNVYTFLARLWAIASESTTVEDYKVLANDRGVKAESLVRWEIVKSPLTGNWLIPGYRIGEAGARLHQLYRYTRAGERMALLPTPELGHAVFGLNLWEDHRPNVAIPEGIWDSIRVWEVMGSLSMRGAQDFSKADSEQDSILYGTNVVGMPSSTIFVDNVIPLFTDKDVTWMFDNDHPRKSPRTGEMLEPAGYAGVRRGSIKILKEADCVSMVLWGESGYDPLLPDGYDLRDSLQDPIEGMRELTSRIVPVPDEWVAASAHGDVIESKTCTSWAELLLAWRNAMEWTDGLEYGLSCMLASVASTRFVGDQLWFKIIGPPSCGKTTLAEAISINRRFCYPKSTIRGFFSGFKAPGGGKDTSLVVAINNKTLITKDGDTLLHAPNLGQILSEARDVYDGSGRIQYRNDKEEDYEGLRTTWLLCGTESLRALDSSELGARFLDCVIMEDIQDELEDSILLRKQAQAELHIGMETTGDASSHYAGEMLEAIQKTGGYINWLKDNAATILPQIGMDPDTRQDCINLGKLVAFMRARPSKFQNEKASRELAARLVSVLTRLAKCQALVRNRSRVDADCMRYVRRVAMNTSRGVVFNIATELFKEGAKGLEQAGIAYRANVSTQDLPALLRFLCDIRLLERCGGTNKNGFRLHRNFYPLFDKILTKVIRDES